MPAPAVIILAAGKGERFLASGGNTHKLDALLHGKPVLTHVLDAVQAAGLAWHLARPDGGTRGMGDSIALGVQATRDAGGWLILPADLPLIQPATLRRVADALREDAVVIPHYQQRQGHPVGFGQQYFAALAALSGDVGAKTIVQQARVCGATLDLTSDDVGIVQDVDRVGDIHFIEKLRKIQAL